MKQTIQQFIARLEHNKERLIQQHSRRDQLDQTICNTEEDIKQLEYTMPDF